MGGYQTFSCCKNLWAWGAVVITSLWSIAFCDPPAGYYATVDHTDSATLRASLHNIIKNSTKIPYTSTATDTWDVLELADQNASNTAQIIDVYKNAAYAKAGGGNSSYDREHSWPNSYGFSQDGSANYPYSDCHHLFLSDIGYNSSRGNKLYRYGNLSDSEKATNLTNGSGGGTGVYPGNSNWTSGQGTSGTWETWRGKRGDVARALLYMDIRYEGGTNSFTGLAEPDLRLTDNPALIVSDTSQNYSVAYMGILSTLIQWNQEDPVSDYERRRNDVVYTYQGNRNPFIDHPEWVNCVFTGNCDGLQTEPALPWINEFHYNNTGSDVGEFVEIAGLAGTDLSGWTLLGYSGANGTVYKTVNLSGVIPNQSGCHGTVGITITGIQNGAPDGLALVSPGNAVVQFISYDGSFTATNGAATGMISTPLPVRETDSTPVAFSLQLAGRGYEYKDFDWQEITTNTQNAVNLGQVFLCNASDIPEPWINEFHYDNTGTDSNEFVEIAGPAGMDLSGWKVLGYSGAIGTVYKTVNLTGTIPSLSGCNGALDFAFTPMQNGPDALALVNPSNEVIQFISYEGRIYATSGAASGMTSVDVLVGETGTTPAGYSLQATGSGYSYGPFAWSAAAAHTRGSINTNQTFSCPPISAPSYLLASSVSASQIDLSWTDNSYNESGFKIYRSVNQTSWTLVGQVGSNVTNFQNTGLSASIHYYYYVQAYNSQNISSVSNTAENWTRPLAPINLSGLARTHKRADIIWTDNTNGELGFKVFRSDNGNTFTQVGAVGANSPRFVDKSLSADDNYAYKVISYNSGGDSPFSTSITLTTLNAPYFYETWDSVSAPHWPAQSYAANTTGTVAGSDSPSIWKTDANHTTTGFRTSWNGWEVGRFAQNATNGTFQVASQTESFQFTTTNTLTAAFETKIDSLDALSDHNYIFELRNESDYNGGGSVILALDGASQHPAITVQSIDKGATSNLYASTFTLKTSNEYWLSADFHSTSDTLEFSYKLYTKSNPAAVLASASSILNKVPRVPLNQARLTFSRNSTGAIDDIYLIAKDEYGDPLFLSQAITPQNFILGNMLQADGMVKEDAPFYRFSHSENESNIRSASKAPPLLHERFIGSPGWTQYSKKYKPAVAQKLAGKVQRAIPDTLQNRALAFLNGKTPTEAPYKVYRSDAMPEGWMRLSITNETIVRSEDETDAEQPDFVSAFVPPSNGFSIVQTPDSGAEYQIISKAGKKLATVKSEDLALQTLPSGQYLIKTDPDTATYSFLMLSADGDVRSSCTLERASELKFFKNPGKPNLLLTWTREYLAGLVASDSELKVGWQFHPGEIFANRSAGSYKLWDISEYNLSPDGQFAYLLTNHKIKKRDGDHILTKEVMLGPDGRVVWEADYKDMTKKWDMQENNISSSTIRTLMPPHARTEGQITNRPDRVSAIARHDDYRLYNASTFIGFVGNDQYARCDMTMERFAKLYSDKLLVDILDVRTNRLAKTIEIDNPVLKSIRPNAIRAVSNRIEVIYSKDNQLTRDVYTVEVQ